MALSRYAECSVQDRSRTIESGEQIGGYLAKSFILHLKNLKE
jgi:hypothetical protein